MTGRHRGALAGLLVALAARGWGAGPPPQPFTLRAADVRYGGVRLPPLLVDWIVRNFDPTPRLRRLPMPVLRAPIRIHAGRLAVGADGVPTATTKESR